MSPRSLFIPTPPTVLVVILTIPPLILSVPSSLQEIGWTHMRILEGVGTLVQLGGLISRLCKLSMNADDFKI